MGKSRRMRMTGLGKDLHAVLIMCSPTSSHSQNSGLTWFGRSSLVGTHKESIFREQLAW